MDAKNYLLNFWPRQKNDLLFFYDWHSFSADIRQGHGIRSLNPGLSIKDICGNPKCEQKKENRKLETKSNVLKAARCD